MVEVLPKHVKDVWDRWNIRGAVILSLTLQAILICFSPLRKRTPSRLLIIFIWISYLLADWSANFAVGLISKNQGKDLNPDDPPQDKKLMALWAPFLLLHLGGPDTITALALEDNALWLRHVFGLVFQVIAGVYVVLLSLPNSLLVIILLVFISGTIKYLERTTALYSASLDKFRNSMIQAPDPGPNYAKLMEEYKAKREVSLPTKIILIDEHDKEHRPKKLQHPKLATKYKRKELTNLEIAQYAYKFFNTFKGLVVNLIFSFKERDESLEIFENLDDPDEALRIIEIELGFLYDALFTKIAVLHTFIGTISRIIASGTLVSAFILFDKRPKKDIHFHGADVAVTYTLFAVGIALDFISILLFLFSDWTCVALGSSIENPEEKISFWRDKVLEWLLSLRKLQWTKQECKHRCTKDGEKPCTMIENEKHVKECSKKHHVLTTNFFVRRWSGSIKVFNFLGYATKSEVKRIHDARGTFQRYSWNITDFLEKLINFVIRKAFAWIFNLINYVEKWISQEVTELSRNHTWAHRTIFPLYFDFICHIPRYIKSVWDGFSEFFHISNKLDLVHKTLFVHEEPMTKELWKFIFEELKNKSKHGESPKNAKMISLARGERTLRDNLPENKKLVRYVTNFPYDQSLLMWHIATEICYQQGEEDSIREDNDYSSSEFGRSISDYREFSKIISDYMMYLLILQPSLMSKVAGIGKIRFRDTLDEANKFFKRRSIKNKISVKDAKVAGIGKIRFRDTMDEANKFFKRSIKNKISVKDATSNIMGAMSELEQMGMKGDQNHSVLIEASRLANELQEMKETDIWEILSKVWMEFLCYAAWHCDPMAQVEQLSRGGELISFVWLLMAHFGLTDSFQINKGDARAKLVIGK